MKYFDYIAGMKDTKPMPCFTIVLQNSRQITIKPLQINNIHTKHYFIRNEKVAGPSPA